LAVSENLLRTGLNIYNIIYAQINQYKAALLNNNKDETMFIPETWEYPKITATKYIPIEKNKH
jgi:hypothetical protein